MLIKDAAGLQRIAAGCVTLLSASGSAAGCAAPLVAVAFAFAMQGRLLGVCMSHNQSIAVTSLTMKAARGIYTWDAWEAMIADRYSIYIHIFFVCLSSAGFVLSHLSALTCGGKHDAAWYEPTLFICGMTGLRCSKIFVRHCHPNADLAAIAAAFVFVIFVRKSLSKLSASMLGGPASIILRI